MEKYNSSDSLNNFDEESIYTILEDDSKYNYDKFKKSYYKYTFGGKHYLPFMDLLIFFVKKPWIIESDYYGYSIDMSLKSGFDELLNDINNVLDRLEFDSINSGENEEVNVFEQLGSIYDITISRVIELIDLEDIDTEEFEGIYENYSDEELVNELTMSNQNVVHSLEIDNS